MRRGTLHLCVAAAFALLPHAAQGQIFADEAARNAARENTQTLEAVTGLLQDLNAKITRLEQGRAQTAALTQKAQQLDAEVRALNGKLEELEQAVKTGLRRAQEAARNNGQEQRLAELEAQLAEAQQVAAALRADLQEITQFVELPPEEELYAAASTAYQNQNLPEAVTGFNRVLKYYPTGQFAANSHYWLGQAHLGLQDYAAARASAERLLADYPESDRRADAMLLSARALTGLGEEEAARTQLTEILTRYPTSLAADSARQLLAQ